MNKLLTLCLALLLAQCQGVPIALHQLVTVDAAGTALIRLQGYDTITASNKVRVNSAFIFVV